MSQVHNLCPQSRRSTSPVQNQTAMDRSVRTGNCVWRPGWSLTGLCLCGIWIVCTTCPTASAFYQDAKVEKAAEAPKAAPDAAATPATAKPAPVKPAEAKAAPVAVPAVRIAKPAVAVRAAAVFVDVAAEDASPAPKVAPPVVVADQTAPTGPMLHLSNGGYLLGEIKDSDVAKSLRWQSPGFASPFDFQIGNVSSISVPLPATPPSPQGEYCFELAGGDVLFGSLLSLSNDSAELDVSRFGRLTVARSQIRRLVRWNNSVDLIYMGPNGLAGWETSAKNQDWREESGHLVTDKDGASIQSRFELPPQASIEFEISWTKKPDFELAFGVDSNAKSVPRAYRFEVWDSDLVIHRETDAEADLASLQEVKSGAGRVNLQMFLDQVQGRAVVFSSSGKQLASLHVPDPKAKPLTGIRLHNKRGDVRLERLRIGRWNGEMPREVEAEKSRIHHPDGSIVYGQVQGYDEKTKEFTLKGDSGESRIAAAAAQTVVLSQGDDPQPRTLRAVFQDGVRISGELSKVEGGHVWLKVPGISQPLHSAWSELQSIVVLTPEPIAVDKSGRIGRLEMAGTKLQGYLVPSPQPLIASCLAWLPIGSTTASPMLPDTSCRVVYREPPPPIKVATPNRPQPQPVVQRNFLLQPFLGSSGPPAVAQTARAGKRFLHLRTGDTIPCEVTSIDEKGINFKTTMSDSTFVAHERVKAIELAPEALVIKVSAAKRERLLTLPRMQRDNPPTHLIRSINGDYLRGRLTEMDAKTLKMEVRLENREVERERIAKIIWLHGDELDPSKKVAAVDSGKGTSRVQVLRSDGIRLTFFAESLADDTVAGKSDVLGVCRADMKQVDQLLVGNSIELAAAQLAYQKWKLQHATEPLAARDEDPSESGRTPGIESSLVGKDAPEFELDLYGSDSKKLNLASLKGKVVVLDFWASWCGPCMQAMPEVDKVVEEFKDKGVQLVGVNLEETPARVKATLDRLKLNLTVVMDKEGLVAAQYGATSIPQTVIIDPAGKITRVFVGSGPQFAGNLRAALASQFAPAEGANPAEAKPGDEAKKTSGDETKPEAQKTEKKPAEEDEV